MEGSQQQRLNWRYAEDNYKEIIFFDPEYDDYELSYNKNKERLERDKQILQNDTWKYTVGCNEEGDNTWKYDLGDDYYDYYNYDYSNGFDLNTAKYVQFPCVFKKPVMEIGIYETNRDGSDFCHFHFGEWEYDYYKTRDYFLKYASVDFETKNPFGFEYETGIVKNELEDLLVEKTKNNIVHKDCPYITYSPFQKDKCGYVAFHFDVFCNIGYYYRHKNWMHFTNDVIVYYAILACDEEEYLQCIENLRDEIVREEKTLKEKNKDDIFFDEHKIALEQEKYLEEICIDAFNLKERRARVIAYRTHDYNNYYYDCDNDCREMIDGDNYILMDDDELRNYLDSTDLSSTYEIGYNEEEDKVKFVCDAMLDGFSYTTDAEFYFEENKDVLPKVLVDAIEDIKNKLI